MKCFWGHENEDCTCALEEHVQAEGSRIGWGWLISVAIGSVMIGMLFLMGVLP